MNRADFIPDVIWVHRDDSGWMYPVDRAADPETWSRLVDGGDAVVTQVDEGVLEDGRGTFPTSSSSGLRAMEEMLALLGAAPGAHVLEIGTGTGYNAALLAEQVAPGEVTTVEVDPGLAAHARAVLAGTGLPVTVVTGDGALGHPARAPYDAVMCTAGAACVPYAWVAQTRPGGRIVVPLIGSFERQAFLRLAVGADGAAHGRFHGGASFMRLRTQRRDKALWKPEPAEGTRVTTTRLYPHEPFTDFEAGFAFGARLPGWVRGYRRDGDGTAVLRVSHRASGSWASLTTGTGGADEHEVWQHGPRNLWDELEAAHRWWADAGKPGHTRFGLTVTPVGQAFWLDTPGQVVSEQAAPPRPDRR